MTDEFFPEIEIRDDQAEVIARGLYAVAKADGNVHERESAMIMEFFNATTDHASHMAALERQPKLEPAHLAAILGTKELRQLFVKTALLLAYVDGDCAANEKLQITDYAKACELDEAAVANLEAAVKDYLVGHLSHLQNIQGVADVAKELKR
ncbi:MAG: TerB family tellurite resistance protein [Deltaproteobacteria bacterium]